MTCGKPAVPRSENPNPDESPRFRVTISSSAMFRAHWSPHCHLTHIHETRTPYTRIIRRPVFIRLSLSLSFFRMSLVTFYVLLLWHTHVYAHTRGSKSPFANTFHTAPRDRTTLYLFSFFFFSFRLSSLFRFTNFLLPTVHQRWTVAVISEQYVETPLLRFSWYRLENARTSYLCLREPRRRRGNRPHILADNVTTSTLPGECLATGWRHLQGISQTLPVLHLSDYVNQNLPAIIELKIYITIYIYILFKKYTYNINIFYCIIL